MRKKFVSVLSSTGLLAAGEYVWCHVAHGRYWRRTARVGRMQCWYCGRTWRAS